MYNTFNLSKALQKFAKGKNLLNQDKKKLNELEEFPDIFSKPKTANIEVTPMEIFSDYEDQKKFYASIVARQLINKSKVLDAYTQKPNKPIAGVLAHSKSTPRQGPKSYISCSSKPITPYRSSNGWGGTFNTQLNTDFEVKITNIDKSPALTADVAVGDTHELDTEAVVVPSQPQQEEAKQIIFDIKQMAINRITNWDFLVQGNHVGEKRSMPKEVVKRRNLVTKICNSQGKWL